MMMTTTFSTKAVSRAVRDKFFPRGASSASVKLVQNVVFVRDASGFWAAQPGSVWEFAERVVDDCLRLFVQTEAARRLAVTDVVSSLMTCSSHDVDDILLQLVARGVVRLAPA